MRVRMKTTAAGPDGVLLAGREVSLSKEKAEVLIDAGYAEEVVVSQVERATAGPKKKATAPAQKKTSSKSKPKKKEASSL